MIFTVLSASATGALFAAIGLLVLTGAGVVMPVIIILSVAISALYGLAELRAIKWWIPTRQWLVPKRWAAYGSPRFEIAFGLLLGPGFFTVIPFVGYHLLLAECLVSRSPLKGAFLMSLFGLARAAPVVLIAIIFRLLSGGCNGEQVALANKWLANLNASFGLVLSRATVLFLVAGMWLSRAVAIP